jgi:hypothetical protein
MGGWRIQIHFRAINLGLARSFDANGSIADWTQLVRNEHGEISSRWVFASTRRWGRDPDNDDVAVYPNSLNAHLRAMRSDKKGFNKGVNRLEDLPWFSLHLVRSVAGNYLDNAPGVPKAGISAMLAHADEETDDRLAPTTKAFYVQNKRMDLKSDAMAAWSEALIKSFIKAGGTMPEPRETFRKSKLKRTTRDGFIVVDTKSPDLSIGVAAVFPARPAE